MEMIFEKCLSPCDYFQTLTGCHIALLDISSRRFLTKSYHYCCNSDSCDAIATHLYGSYEAERWGGKYIYYCPIGLTYIATPPLFHGKPMQYSFIAGPILMINFDDYGDEENDQLKNMDGVVRMTTAQVRSFSEILFSSILSISLDNNGSATETENQDRTLSLMYDLSSKNEFKYYSRENERKLQDYIKIGERESAQKLLNELLTYIYIHPQSDFEQIKARARELIILMSRSAIDGGADETELYNLCHHYSLEIDSITNAESLNRLINAALNQFIRLIFDFSEIKHRHILFMTSAYIKAHISEKISLNDAAENVHMSKSYFCRILKDELGTTFTEYVNSVRIERSKTLLRSTDMRINEIADAVGYDGQGYYTRIFKKSTGISPLKYRTMNK